MFKVKSQFIIHNFRAKIKDQIKLFCCQARVIKWQWQICTGLECANANTSCVKYNSDAYMPNIRNPRSMPGSDKLINQGITTGSICFKIIIFTPNTFLVLAISHNCTKMDKSAKIWLESQLLTLAKCLARIFKLNGKLFLTRRLLLQKSMGFYYPSLAMQLSQARRTDVMQVYIPGLNFDTAY